MAIPCGDTKALLAASVCYKCLTPRQRRAAVAWLICQWSNGGSAPPFVIPQYFTTSGAGQSSANEGFYQAAGDPTFYNSLGSNFIITHVAGVWTMMDNVFFHVYYTATDATFAGPWAVGPFGIDPGPITTRNTNVLLDPNGIPVSDPNFQFVLSP